MWVGVAEEAVSQLPAAIGAPRAKAVHAKLLAMGKRWGEGGNPGGEAESLRLLGKKNQQAAACSLTTTA